jgi:hypothetical protein
MSWGNNQCKGLTMDTMFLSLDMLIALEDLEMQELLVQQQQVFESEQIPSAPQDNENKPQDIHQDQ